VVVAATLLAVTGAAIVLGALLVTAATLEGELAAERDPLPLDAVAPTEQLVRMSKEDSRPATARDGGSITLVLRDRPVHPMEPSAQGTMQKAGHLLARFPGVYLLGPSPPDGAGLGRVGSVCSWQ